MKIFKVRRTSLFKTKVFQLIIELENGRVFRIHLRPTMRNFHLCQDIEAVLLERSPEAFYTGCIMFFK